MRFGTPVRRIFSRVVPISLTFRESSDSQITTTAEYVKVYIGDLKNVVDKKHLREKQYRRKK